MSAAPGARPGSPRRDIRAGGEVVPGGCPDDGIGAGAVFAATLADTPKKSQVSIGFVVSALVSGGCSGGSGARGIECLDARPGPVSRVEVAVSKIRWWLAAAVVAAVQGCASTGSVPDRDVIGRVEGIYVEMRPGVLVHQRLAPEDADLPVWANVKLRDALEDGRTSMSARLDRGLVVARGDMVNIRRAPEGRFATVKLAPDTVVAVVPGDEFAPVAADRMPNKVSMLDALR